jgi:hypothetical protein
MLRDQDWRYSVEVPICLTKDYCHEQDTITSRSSETGFVLDADKVIHG